MQTNQPLPQQLFIQRHCLQQLLHEAISDEQNPCHGLLSGRGNIITRSMSVTNKVFHTPALVADGVQEGVILGAYVTTDKHGVVDAKAIANMRALSPDYVSCRPYYFLVLYLDHKGRIDARAYADAELQAPITLNMQEDGNQEKSQ